MVHLPGRASHTARIAGHLGCLALFVTFTAIGVRSLLHDPAGSPVDKVLWLLLVVLGLYLGALTAAALLDIPLLGRRVAAGTAITAIPNGLLLGLAIFIIPLSIAFHRWFGAAAYALIAAGTIYPVRFLPRPDARPPSRSGPTA